MKKHTLLTALAAALPLWGLNAATINLASTMDLASSMALQGPGDETFIISNGDGTIANGNAGDDDSDPNFGGKINLFPREQGFLVGDLTFEDGSATGVGTEVFSIQSYDLSDFWTSDPTRTSSTPTDASVESDISDYAIGLWLFNYPGEITFGALDASDTVTFTDGVLTSIDLSIPTNFIIDATSGFGVVFDFEGTFSIVGNSISYHIDDTQATPSPPFPFSSVDMQANLTGTVNAVAVPEPQTYALIAGAGVLTLAYMRRRKA